MVAPGELLRTTIGKKVVMALSGVIWFGYVIGHLLGNLQIYAGPDKINGYAEFLHHAPALLWGTRLLLLFAIVAHVVASVQLSMRNLSARPIAYARRTDLATSYAVKRSTTSGSGYTTLPAGGMVMGTSFTDTTVTNGTQYFYVVAANDATSQGPNSTQVAATPTGEIGRAHV